MVGVGRGVRDKRGVRVVTVDGIGGWGLGLGQEVGLGLGEGVGLGSEIKRRGGEVGEWSERVAAREASVLFLMLHRRRLE